MIEHPESLLKDKEHIDDLERNGYGIIQRKDGFCFGMDAVLLSGFAQIKEGENVLDLGTGTGIIPILLEAKTKGRRFTGLEIQEEVADMARRSVCLNQLEEKVEIVLGDIKEAGELFPRSSFDVVTSNPPYIRDDHGLKNPEIRKAVSRHEVLCTLDDVGREAAKLVKPGGRFYLVHRPRRLAEVITSLKQNGLEPKRLKMVHPFVDKEANMVLIEAVKGGRAMMKVEAPIVVFQGPGTYSEEIRAIYGY